MGKRDARLAIEKDYKAAMGVRRLKMTDDTVINDILEIVRTWQGFFPGETEDSVAVNREMDKRAVKGFTDGLIKHFRALELVDSSKSDYYNLFTLYKEYIQSDPTGAKHPTNTIDKKVIPPMDEAVKERDRQAEKDVSESPRPVQEEVASLIKTKKEKENKEMASLNDVMETAGGILGQQLPTQRVSTGVDMEGLHVQANDLMREQQAARLEWTRNHPIKYLMVVHKPLKERLADPTRKSYPITNPSQRMTKIVDQVWAEQGKHAESGTIDEKGCIKGELVIPNCVAAVGAENIENFRLVMTTLQKAAEDPNYEVEVDLDYRFSGWKGAEFTKPIADDESDTVVKWAKLKEVIDTYGSRKAYLDSDASVLVEAKSLTNKQLAKKKQETASDWLTLRAIGTASAIDVVTGVVTEGVARYAYEVLDENDNEPVRNARSKMKFRYKKMVRTGDGDFKERTASVALYLIVPVKQEKLVQADYEIFKTGSLGQRLTETPDDELLSARVADVISQFIKGVGPAELTNRMHNYTDKARQADAGVAEEADEELM